MAIATQEVYKGSVELLLCGMFVEVALRYSVEDWVVRGRVFFSGGLSEPR
jgi:hypothetical protein